VVVQDRTFDKNPLLAHRRQAIERQQRMAQVIERAEKKHGVESAQFFGRDVINTHLAARTLCVCISERFFAQVEGRPTAARHVGFFIQAVGKIINRHHFFRATFQGLEGPVAIPGADIQHTVAI
jgi:hypothetical protein